MPYTFNGIGSWYYGKKNEYTYTGTCEFCGSHTHLMSYDTTKFFVFLFIPILPLGEKRILDECVQCKRHRYMPLKEWERYQKESTNSLYNNWLEQPNNVEKATELLQLIVYFKNTDLLDSVRRNIYSNCSSNSEILNLLGSVHVYFNQFDDAETAYNASLFVKQDREVGENLAEALMKNKKPDKAKGLISHIIENNINDKLYFIFLLIESYQYIGEHRLALEVIQECENAFPELKKDKSLNKYRKISKRSYDTDRQVKGSLICDNPSKKNSVNFSFLLPKLFLPMLITLVLMVYVISSFIIGLSQKVYLVNGLDISYSVEINGKKQDLAPMSKTVIRIPEGKTKVNVLDLDMIEPNFEFLIKTPFWSRLQNRPIYILNPDKVAIFLWQETIYASEYILNSLSDYEMPYRYYSGEFFYNLDKVDYLFKDFPESITVGEYDKRAKSQLLHLNDIDPTLYFYFLQDLKTEKAVSYLKTRLMFAPENEFYIYMFLSYSDIDSSIDFLKTRLDERPLLINWHRAYQTYVETHKPTYDLVQEYSVYLEKENDNKHLYYLLSRVVDDPKEAEKLLLKSIEGSDPCPYGYYGLAYQSLSYGNYEKALDFAQRAVDAMPTQDSFYGILNSAMLALGEYDSLLSKNQAAQKDHPDNGHLVAEEIRLHISKSDIKSSENAISNYLNRVKSNGEDFVQGWSDYLFGVIAYCSNDITTYSNAIEEFESPVFVFENAFIRGDFHRASMVAQENELNASYFLLLYLAQNNPDEASEYLKKAIERFETGDKTSRFLADYLSGRKNWTLEDAKSLILLPDSKHIAMAALAKIKPEYQKELFELAQKLNYEKEFPYHFIKELVEDS
ncbi:UNVERIFIED_CONTAM: hypothetical protein Cloal_0894 [Acetivibrio alkalicellulosi]